LNLFIKLFFIIIFSVGAAGHLSAEYRGLMLKLTPFILYLSAGIILFTFYNEKNRNIIKWCIAAYLLTFASEVIGVSTGLLFGNYNYGDVLGFKLFNVPLIIGLNWTIIIAGASSIAINLIQNKSLVPFAAAFIAVIFDYILEPAAVSFGYWRWHNDIIPLFNYVTWFILAYIASYMQLRMNAVQRNDIPQTYLIVQSVFFIILNFI
jgi:putative membrane protein